MACIRKRRNKWVVDYRDGAGVRRWITCGTRREAEATLIEKARESRQPIRPIGNPNVTVSAYAEQWLRLIAGTVKPRTQQSYGQTLRLHILPGLGTTKIRMLHKGHIKSLLVDKLREGKVKTLIEGDITRELRL